MKPFSPGEIARRQQKARVLMRSAGVDGILVNSYASMYYLSGAPVRRFRLGVSRSGLPRGSAPEGLRVRRPASALADLQDRPRPAPGVEVAEAGAAVSYTHLTLPTSDLV